jgi:hypothetical protein
MTSGLPDSKRRTGSIDWSEARRTAGFVFDRSKMTGAGRAKIVPLAVCGPGSADTDAFLFAWRAEFFRAIRETPMGNPYSTEQQMATLEAFRAVLDDEGTPEIIRNHIIDSLQYTLRNYGQVFTSKEVEWLAVWDDARIPLAASRELKKRVAETTR